MPFVDTLCFLFSLLRFRSAFGDEAVRGGRIEHDAFG